MYKIAVLDDDEHWCLAIQRFFRKSFEVSTYGDVHSFLAQSITFYLVIIYFSIPPARFEKNMNGCELICYLKATLFNPPILVLATGFVSRRDLGLGKEICPQADDFVVKDMGLDEVLQQIRRLLLNRVPRHSPQEM